MIDSLLGAIAENLEMCFKDVGEFRDRIKELNNSTLNVGQKLVDVLNGLVQSCRDADDKHHIIMKILESNIASNGFTAMENMCSTIEDFKHFCSCNKQNVEQSYAKIQEVEAEVECNAEKISCTMKNIMELVNTFREKCCATIVEAGQVETKATLAAEKARQIVEAVKELDILTDEIEQEAETVEVTLAGYSENISNSKTSVINDIVEHLTQIRLTTKKTFENREADKLFVESVPEEVEYFVSEVNNLLNRLYSRNNHEFDGNFKSIRAIKTEVEHKIQAVHDAFQVNIDENVHKIKFQKYEECFYNRIKKRQLEFEQCSERGLRDIYNEYYNHKGSIKTEESKIIKAFSNIVEHAKVFKYRPDAPLATLSGRWLVEIPSVLLSTIHMKDFPAHVTIDRSDNSNQIAVHEKPYVMLYRGPLL
ncbi:hypothetical protein J6590_035613 [Homalodisca vitripennis]|nr:hypothetical protein J6590_035613 [Homalodisca vitripennis]